MPTDLTIKRHHLIRMIIDASYMCVDMHRDILKSDENSNHHLQLSNDSLEKSYNCPKYGKGGEGHRTSSETPGVLVRGTTTLSNQPCMVAHIILP